jgi:hypothetical protein
MKLVFPRPDAPTMITLKYIGRLIYSCFFSSSKRKSDLFSKTLGAGLLLLLLWLFGPWLVRFQLLYSTNDTSSDSITSLPKRGGNYGLLNASMIGWWGDISTGFGMIISGSAHLAWEPLLLLVSCRSSDLHSYSTNYFIILLILQLRTTG